MACSAPGVFPFTFKMDNKIFRANDADEMGFWRIPAAGHQTLFDNMMARVVAARVRAEIAKQAKQAKQQEAAEESTAAGDESDGAVEEEDALNQSSQGDSLNKGPQSPQDNIPGAATTHTILTEREAWPMDARLSRKRLQAEYQHCQTRRAAGVPLVPLDEMFPFIAGNEIQMRLQTAGKMDAGLASQWRVTYANDQMGLIKYVISLMPEDGVPVDVVGKFAAVRLRNNNRDATVASKYLADMCQVLADNTGFARLEDYPKEKCTDVFGKVKKFYEQSKIHFYNKVGEMVFADNKWGKRPETLWDLCVKTQVACTTIAEAAHMYESSRSDGQSNTQEKRSNHQHENKRSRDSLNQGSDREKKSKTEEEVYDCNVCGRTDHHPDRCRLKDHPHANRERGVAWKDSKWANVYATKLPYPSSVLNARNIAVQDTDGKYTYKKWDKSASTDRNIDRDNKRDDRRDRHSAKSNRGPQYGVSRIATTNLNNFVTGKSTFNPLISARSVNNPELTLGTGILDSGAFGGHINNYVNQAMVDSLIASGDTTSTCACHSTKICTITGCVSSSTCVKLKIQLFNNLGQQITIDTIARVVNGLPYNFIIGLTTIRRYKLALVFDSLFEELEGVAEMYAPVDKNEINMKSEANTFESKDVRTASYTSTYSAKSAIKLSSGRPIFASRGHEVDVDAVMHQLTECNRHHSTPVGGNLPNSVACKCDTKHTLWCAACSTSASSQAVEDHAYSREVINLVECKTTTDNRASAYSQKIAMPEFVRTILTRQLDNIEYLNTIHSKDEFLDIEDDSDNIDEFIEETPYDKLCSPSVTISDNELLRAIKIEGTDEFLLKANLLIEKYTSRFRSSLTSEAARLKAFELELQSESNWYTSKNNKLPTRLQSLNKRNATREFVKNALATGLIEPSQAESWSQIHLTPKSGGKWRFCVDYRFLNKETTSMGWPLPNIKQMLERIGKKSPSSLRY
jgi:hypothetical protein